MACYRQLVEREGGRLSPGSKLSMERTGFRYYGPCSSFEPTSPGEVSAVYNVEWSPSGTACVCCLKNGFATLVDARTWAAVGSLHGHTESVNVARFRGEHTVFTGSDDMTAREWDLRRLSSSQVVSPSIASAAARTGGASGSASSSGTTLYGDDVASNTTSSERGGDCCVRVYRGHTSWVKNTEPLCDDFLLTYAFDGCINLWDTRASSPASGIPPDSRDCCMANPALWLQRGCLRPLAPNVVFHHPNLSRIAVHADVAGNARNAKLALAVKEAVVVVHGLAPRSLAPALDRAWAAMPTVVSHSISLNSDDYDWATSPQPTEEGFESQEELDLDTIATQRRLNGQRAAYRCSPPRAAAALAADRRAVATPDDAEANGSRGPSSLLERNVVELQWLDASALTTSMRFSSDGSRLALSRVETRETHLRPQLGEQECLVLDTGSMQWDASAAANAEEAAACAASAGDSGPQPVPSPRDSAAPDATWSPPSASSPPTGAAAASMRADGPWVIEACAAASPFWGALRPEGDPEATAAARPANGGEAMAAPLEEGDDEAHAALQTAGGAEDLAALRAGAAERLASRGIDPPAAQAAVKRCTDDMQRWLRYEHELAETTPLQGMLGIHASEQCRTKASGLFLTALLQYFHTRGTWPALAAFWEGAAPVTWSSLASGNEELQWPSDAAAATPTRAQVVRAMAMRDQPPLLRRPLDWMDPVAMPVRVASRCFVSWICDGRPAGIIKGPHVDESGTVAAFPNGSTVALVALEGAHRHWLRSGVRLRNVLPGSEKPSLRSPGHASAPPAQRSAPAASTTAAPPATSPLPGRAMARGMERLLSKRPLWLARRCTAEHLASTVPGLDTRPEAATGSLAAGLLQEPMPGLSHGFVGCAAPQLQLCRPRASPEAPLLSLDRHLLALVPSEAAAGPDPAGTGMPAACVLTVRFEPAGRNGAVSLPRLLLTLNSGQVTVVGHLSDEGPVAQC